MADHTTFVDNDPSASNLVPAAWFNDANTAVYRTLIACTVGGTANAITLTPPSGFTTGLIDGLELSFTPTLTSTSAAQPSISYNGGAVKSVFAPNGIAVAGPNDIVAGMPVKVRWVAAANRFVIVSPPLSFNQATGLRGTQLAISPVTATTFNVSSFDSNGVLVWDSTKLAFDVALIGPGGLANGAVNTANCTLNGTAGSSLSANTLYYMYLYQTVQPKVDFSTTGPAVSTYNGIQVKTGDISRTYIGMLYTLDTGGGIDILVDANGSGSHLQLVSVSHSHYYHDPLMLQTDQITVAGFASAAMTEISTKLRADVVMEGTLGFFYKTYGYAVLDTVGATVGIECAQTTGGTAVNCVCQGTARGVGDSIPLASSFGRALATGHYAMQTLGKISAGTAAFHLTSEVWIVS